MEIKSRGNVGGVVYMKIEIEYKYLNFIKMMLTKKYEVVDGKFFWKEN